MKIFRWLNKIYAHVFGYFWLPCPCCKEYFGGHEWNNFYQYRPQIELQDENGFRITSSNGICNNCAIKLAGENGTYVLVGTSDKEAEWVAIKEKEKELHKCKLEDNFTYSICEETQDGKLLLSVQKYMESVSMIVSYCPFCGFKAGEK